MKNLITYLKALWSWVSGSQRKKIGVTLGEATIEHPFSTYSAPFGTCWQPSGKLHSVVRCAAMLVMLFTIGSGNAWGALSSPYTCTFTSGMSMSGSNCTTGDVTWTVSTTTGKGSPSITFGNQNGQSCIKLGSGQNNYYSKITLTTSAFTSYNVSSVVIYASSNNGGSKTFKVTQGATQIGTGSQSFSSTTWVTNITRNTNTGSGGDLSIEITNDKTATFIHSIKVTYSAASCTTKPTVGSSLTSVSATVNSITATVPISAIGGCNITENGLVYSTTVATPTVGAANCTKVTTTACGSTAANKTVEITGLTCGQSYYVRGYATNAAGTSYTNVTTQSTSACPLYTITYNAGSGTCATSTWTQGSVGASTTLPTATLSCDGWSFAGWCTSSAGNAEDNTTSPGTILDADDSYTPTDDVTLYAVYTKTEGGGGGSSETDTEEGKTTTPYVQNTGWTASAGGTYTSAGNFGDSSPSIKMSSDGNWIQSATYSDAITNISFWYKPQNATGSISTFVSTNGSTWTELTSEEVSFSSSSTAGTKSISISSSNNYKVVKIVYNKTTSNVAIDDIAITHGGGGTTYYMTNYACESCTAPTGLATGTINSTSIQVTITDPANTGTYEIYYNQSGTAPTSGTGASATVNTTTPNITGLASGETYYMWVRAKCGESSKSDWVALTGSTFTTTCGDPSSTSNGATTHATTGGNGTQVLNWSGDPSNYEIYYHGSSTAPSPSQSPSRTVNGAKTETITGLTPGTYYWWVRSKCSSGKGDWVAGPSFTINGIKIGGTTPVAFGEVAQGSSVTPKTIKVSGIGLASGSNITASFPVGSPFSASPTSVAYNADKADLSISASTATVGDYDQYLTLSYNGGAYTATVKVTMTVVRSITYSINGVENTVLSADGATILSVLPASPASCDDTNYPTFYGWTTSPINGSTTTPPTIVTTEVVNATTAEETYYAVFAKGSQYWGRLTSSELSGLSAGTELVIVAVDQGYVLKNDLTCSSSMPAETDGKITPTDDIKWALAGSSGAWQLKSGTDILGTLYSNCPGSGNGLALNFNTYFQTYSIASSSHGTNEFYIKANDCTEGVLTKVSKYDNFRVVTTSSYSSAASAALKLYIKKGSYSEFITNCCNTPTLAFAASPYAVIRQDIQGASTTTWAEVDVTFTSTNTTGTISATTYTDSKTVYKMSSWQSRSTTDVSSLCATGHAYFEVLTQPSGATPGTGKFHVKTTTGYTGQGTYRIAITQAATDAEHGNYCEATVYGFVDVTLRDKFVDKLNDNGTVNKDGHGAQLATPLLSELGTQVENACHSEGRKLKGWIKETDLKSKYETGNSERVQTIDGLCETCDDATDWTSLIVAPGTNVTMSGATWYAVWAYER